jgi:hypothetical protein
MSESDVTTAFPFQTRRSAGERDHKLRLTIHHLREVAKHAVNAAYCADRLGARCHLRRLVQQVDEHLVRLVNRRGTQ